MSSHHDSGRIEPGLQISKASTYFIDHRFICGVDGGKVASRTQ